MAHALPTPAAWRALAAVCAITLGYTLARHASIPSSGAFGVACAGCALAALTTGWACRAALFLAAASAAGGWFSFRLIESPAVNPLTARETSPLPITIVGIARTTPQRDRHAPSPLRPLAPAPWRFDLDARTIEPDHRPARGIVRVSVIAPELPPIAPGSVVSITGIFSPPTAPANPGEPDRRLLDRQAGVVGSIHAPAAQLVSTAGKPDSTLDALRASWLELRESLQHRAQRLLLGDAHEPSAARALLANLVLGLREQGLDDVRGPFTRIGLAHVLAISGFHLALMTSVGLFLLRLPRDLGSLEPLVVLALLAVYLAVLPFNAPIWRCALAVAAVLLADASGRRYDPLALLAWIAAALLIVRPLDLWSLGFQLSFGLVALMIRYGTSFDAALFGPRLRGLQRSLPEPLAALGLAIRRLASTTLLCVLASAPLVAHHTGLLSPSALLSGFLLIPPMSLLLAGAYVALLLGVLVPPADDWLAHALRACAEACAAIANAIDAIPGSSIRLPSLSLAWTAAATAVVLLFISRPRRRDVAFRFAACALTAWTAAELLLGPRLPRHTLLRIDSLAVGDGACHLVRSGSDALLWDCGSLSSSLSPWMIPRALRDLGAWRVPTAVVTHPNLDHFNALADVAEAIGLRTLLVPNAFLRAAESRPAGGEAFLLHHLRTLGVTVRPIARGHAIPLGRASVEFLSPPPDADWPESNNHSLVAIVRAPASDAILLTGDVQDRAINALRDAGGLPRIAVMEAPHHGSAKPAAIDWLRHLDPTVVIQSTGPSRANDPRWTSTRAARLWLCTAESGAAWAELRDDGSLRAGSFRTPARAREGSADPPGTDPSGSPATLP
ncbi:MAG: ComEC/Rec2 family competence protein [Phycisphaerae bacterium]|nr:ComEC/Rec2 family competence protein [Phycisphaerae bacterium]